MDNRTFFHPLIRWSRHGVSAADFGHAMAWERTTILVRPCGANRGWRIALTFCFFFVKEKENEKTKKKVGIVAKYPNEYLHVDTTFYPLIDEKNICISFVMDNYSKMILGYHVANANTFDIVRNSLSKALKVIAKHPSQKHSFLVADGGKENHNKYIDAFIAKLSKHKITKIRALKDIRFSNSPAIYGLVPLKTEHLSSTETHLKNLILNDRK